MIQKIYKEFNISSSHKLDLPYESKCNRLHGHNYKIEVSIGGIVDSNFMIMDFTILSKIVKYFDHKDLNDLMVLDRFYELEVQPTAEMLVIRIAKDILEWHLVQKEKTIKGLQIRAWETGSCYADVFIQEKEFPEFLQSYVTNLEILPMFHAGGIIDPQDMVKIKDEIAAKSGDHIIESK